MITEHEKDGLTRCTECTRWVVWHYCANCWHCAKRQLASEDANDMVPVVIDPAMRAILEAAEPPA